VLGHVLGLTRCIPYDDLSSYRSSAEAEAPPSPPSSADGTVIATRPAAPGDAVDGAAGRTEVGEPPGFTGRAALPPESEAPASEDGATASDAGPPAGPPGVLVGSSRQTLDVGGVQRSFLYHVPPGLDPSVPAPVLIVAHGFEETAADMASITGYDAIADREGFVVLYPEGQGRVPWNLGSDVCQGGARPIPSASGDDEAFLDAMLAFVAQGRALDAEHVFLSGLSSGAYLANDLGCRRSDIAAVASHSGGSHAFDTCVAAHKPVLLLHGSADVAVPIACSVEARDRWAEHNGCTTDAAPLEVLGGVCEALGCPEDGQVTFCSFEGMGRGWAGGGAQAASFLEFASASELSWSFFETFAW
jgi:polyhydroxybutyrate depolymerase